MFSSVLLLFGLASICQYVTSSNKIGQNNDTKSMTIEPEKQISNVILKNKTSGSWFCGGNLINTAYILTAAECAVDRRPEDIIVYAGHRRLDEPDMIAHPIGEIIIHEEYDLRDPWRNNIALLRLMNSIDTTLYVNRYIRLVPVPNSSERRELTEVQAELQQKRHILPATISGYGITAKDQSYSSDEILKFNAFITDWMLCKELLKDSYNISESHMCTEDPYPWKRISDVGGPLIFDSSVVGIALYEEWKKPASILLFTNVLSHWKWIQRQIESRKNTDVTPFNYTWQAINKPIEKRVITHDTNELTFHVLLQNKSNLIFFCAGSVINPHFVLTAAECVAGRDSDMITVVANFQDFDQSYPYYQRSIAKIIIHNDYNLRNPWRNDIALLKLKDCYPSSYIRKVYLAHGSVRREIAELARPITARVSGFGIISDFQEESSRQMMESFSRIYEWKFCKELFETVPYNMSKSQICASDPFNHKNFDERRTSDVGSPLVYGSNIVVGIALYPNWGIRLNNTQYYTNVLLFTNTTPYNKWIRTQIQENLPDVASIVSC